MQLRCSIICPSTVRGQLECGQSRLTTKELQAKEPEAEAARKQKQRSRLKQKGAANWKPGSQTRVRNKETTGKNKAPELNRAASVLLCSLMGTERAATYQQPGPYR